MDKKTIEQFTDEELLAVIRQAENTNISGSLFQRASNEWNIRHQQKILEATKTGPHPGVYIAARNIQNNGSITGHRVDVITENYAGEGTVSSYNLEKKEKQNFISKITNNQTFSVIFGTLILLLVLYFIYVYFGINLSQYK